MDPTFKKLTVSTKMSIPAIKVFISEAPSLKYVLCIYYPIQFKKDQIKMQALLNFGSEVKVMTPAYAAKLGLKVRSINFGAKNINGSTFKMFVMVLASF